MENHKRKRLVFKTDGGALLKFNHEKMCYADGINVQAIQINTYENCQTWLLCKY